jgi:hypothetical protein
VPRPATAPAQTAARRSARRPAARWRRTSGRRPPPRPAPPRRSPAARAGSRAGPADQEPASALQPGSPRQAVVRPGAASERMTSTDLASADDGRRENHHQNRESHIRPTRHAAHPGTNYQVRTSSPDFASALGSTCPAAATRVDIPATLCKVATGRPASHIPSRRAADLHS